MNQPTTPIPVSHPQNGLQDYVAVSRYARFNPAKNRRETWSEAVERVKRMHLEYYPNKSLAAAVTTADLEGKESSDLINLLSLGQDLHSIIKKSFEAVDQREVLPSMRSLQFGGEAVLTKHVRIFNCAFTYIDRLDAFREVFYLLLCGCGVGFSVQKQHVACLPALGEMRDEPRVKWVIEDTIEGWADALDAMMKAAVDGRFLRFDYSLIRPAGAPLKTSGGKAPGPVPLFNSLTQIEKILTQAMGRRLRTIEVYDILMWVAKAVLSGGIRRSATLCLFSLDDNEMAEAKTGDWFTHNPQRAASNNSAIIVRDKARREDFQRIFNAQKEFGEPGFYFVENEDYGANPCVEIGLHPRLKVDEEDINKLREYGYQGALTVGQELSGVQFCNLTTISALASESAEKFWDLCRYAAVLGTIQAGYTDFKYLSPVSRLLTERDSLLGVSLCGILDRPELLLDPEILREGAALVKSVNRGLSQLIGIRSAARCTCVKPEGTASLLLGTSSGIHPHHSARYFRRVQASVHDPIFLHFKKTNPHMVEASVYDPNGMTDVIAFPVEAPTFGILRADLSALKHLEYVLLVQKNWVEAGGYPSKASPGLNHNVSCTISVKPNEWDQVENFIWQNKASFTGVALLRDTGDKCYLQAPREEVKTDADIHKWNQLRYEVVRYEVLEEELDETELREMVACGGGACELI